jgi:hypothetical protein
MPYTKEKIHTIVCTQVLCDYQRDLQEIKSCHNKLYKRDLVDNHIRPVYKQLCVFSPLCTTLRPEYGRARPKRVVTIGNKIQNQDSCFFRRTPHPSFDSAFRPNPSTNHDGETIHYGLSGSYIAEQVQREVNDVDMDLFSVACQWLHCETFATCCEVL